MRPASFVEVRVTARSTSRTLELAGREASGLKTRAAASSADFAAALILRRPISGREKLACPLHRGIFLCSEISEHSRTLVVRKLSESTEKARGTPNMRILHARFNCSKSRLNTSFYFIANFPINSSLLLLLLFFFCSTVFKVCS